MSLLHIGVALGLSAAAAFLVTGAAMQPIEPDVAATCTSGGQVVVAGPPCLSAEDMRSTDGAVDIQPDAGWRVRGR